MKKLKLYHYPHCPYCVRVRMVAGYKKIDLELIELDYDDEKTPISMIGKKALPILELIDGEYLPESLDIIEYLEEEYPDPSVFTEEVNRVMATETFERIRRDFDDLLYKICMPYWASTDEFSESAREYFVNKKQEALGEEFTVLRDRYTEFEQKMLEALKPLEKELGDNDFIFEKFSIADILICAHLKGLDDVPEWSFSDNLSMYMQRVRNLTRV